MSGAALAGLSRRLLACLLVTAAVLLVYGHALNAPFVFDDSNFANNPGLHATTLGELVGVLFIEFPQPWTEEVGARRLGYLTFAFNHYLHRLDPFGYRLGNVFIHLLNGLLIYWLLQKTLLLPRLRNALAPQPVDRFFLIRRIAFFTALLWLVHPVQIQAVTYVIQRLESLSSFFILLALVLYLKGRLRGDWLRYLFFSGCVLAGLLGMGVKQKAAILPVLIFTYDSYFFHESPWSSLKKRWSILLLLALLLLAGAMFFLGPAFWSSIAAGYSDQDFTMTQRLLTEARVVLYYLSLLAWPLPSRLNLDYDYPISTSLLDPASTLFAVGAIATLLGFALATAKKHRLLSFAILWFFACLTLESTIIPLELVYEHRLYLASLGPIALATGFVCRHLRWQPGFSVPVVLLLAAAVLGFWTWERNQVWTSPLQLWTDNAVKSPNKARVQVSLGDALRSAGRHRDAETAYETALRLDGDDVLTHVNLASLYIERRRYPQAEALLRLALAKGFHHPKVYNNLALIALAQGREEEALGMLAQVFKLDARDLMAHELLSLYYMNQQQLSEALQVADRGLAYWPNAHRLLLRKGQICLKLGRVAQAGAVLQAGLRLRPDDPQLRHYYRLVDRLLAKFEQDQRR